MHLLLRHKNRIQIARHGLGLVQSLRDLFIAKRLPVPALKSFFSAAPCSFCSNHGSSCNVGLSTQCSRQDATPCVQEPTSQTPSSWATRAASTVVA